MKKVLVILIMSTSFLSCKKDNTNPQNNLFSVSQAVVPQVAITMLDDHIKTSIIKGDTTINTFNNSTVIGYVIADKTDLTKVTLIYVGKIKKLTLYGKKAVIGGNVFYRINEKSGKEIYSFTTDIQQTHAWNFHVSELPIGISPNPNIELSYLGCMRAMFNGCFNSWGCGIICGVNIWSCSQGWSLTCFAAALQ